MEPKRPQITDLDSESWYSYVQKVEGVQIPELAPDTELCRGRFVVRSSLGKGAMGQVYEVLDRERGRDVALKALRLRSPEAAYALKQEFRSLSDLVHPNLVRLHELFVEPSSVYFTMDLVRGIPFDRSDHSRLGALLAQLVAGVQTLHAAGKLHRDLKPANVLVEPSGRVVILDFGLVHDSTRARDPQSSTGSTLVGTPRYMAPEVLSWGHTSEQSDWYSVGVMLFETLTGQLLDDGGLSRVVRQSRPEPPSSRRPEITREFDEICAALLDPDPAKRADGDDILASLGVESIRPPRSVAPVSTHLVGRDQQLSRLSEAFQKQLESKEPLAVMLSGQSGMGKTSLLQEFVRQQTSGGDVTVLWGACHEQEAVSHKALDEVIDALSRHLIDRYADRIFELIKPEEAQYLLRLFPALGRIPTLTPLVGDDEDADPRELRKQAYDALCKVLTRLSARRPLVIVIDDVQWGDVDSARLLYELFAGASSPRCLLVLSYRSDEAAESACLQALLSGSRCLADVMEVRTMSVSELQPADARTLAYSLLNATPSSRLGVDEAQRVEGLVREAQGSPLLLHELAAHRRDAPPLSGSMVNSDVALADVVRTRLNRIGQLGRQLFRLLCVAGTPVRESLLRAALGGADIDGSIIQLETERLIRARTSRSADAVEVVHDRIRRATLAEVSPEALRTLHEDLARAHTNTEQPDVEALARHYAGAKLKAESAYWAQKAAALAKTSLAFDHAAELYSTALSLLDSDSPTRNYLRIQLANALADAGRGPEAGPLFLEIARSCPPEEALEYRRRAADQWLVTGHIERGLDVLRSVYKEVGMSLPGGNTSALMALTGNRFRVSLRGSDFVKKGTDELDAQQLLRVDACKAGWMLSFVNPMLGAALQARFLRLALEAGEPSRVAMGIGIEALQRSVEGNNTARRELQKRARDLAETIGTPHAMGFQDLVDCNCAYLAGEWRECSRWGQRSELTLTRRCRGSTWELNTLRFFWGMSLYYQGKFRELRRRSTAWLRDAEDRGDRCAQSGYRFNGARAWCLTDDTPDKAHQEIERGLAEWSFPGMGVHRFLAAIAKVQVQLYEDDLDGARVTARTVGSEFRLSGMRRVQLVRILLSYHIAYVALARAARAATDGNQAEKKAEMRRAARHQHKLETERTAWGDAYASYIEAQLSLLANRREVGLSQLARAVDKLQRCDMAALASGARYRLGLLQGGEDGAANIERAHAFMRSAGVVAPERLLLSLAPGL